MPNLIALGAAQAPLFDFGSRPDLLAADRDSLPPAGGDLAADFRQIARQHCAGRNAAPHGGAAMLGHGQAGVALQAAPSTPSGTRRRPVDDARRGLTASPRRQRSCPSALRARSVHGRRHRPPVSISKRGRDGDVRALMVLGESYDPVTLAAWARSALGRHGQGARLLRQGPCSRMGPRANACGLEAP